MPLNVDLFWLGRGVVALVAFALAVVLFDAVADERSAARRAFYAYTSDLDRKLRFLRIALSGPHVAAAQFGVSALIVGVAVATGHLVLLLTLAAVCAGPIVVLEKRAARRVTLIEQQVEAWLNAIANSLKASPSLGEAISESVPIIPSPICEEVDVLVKENALGTPLDVALDLLVERIRSRTLSGAVLALKVARKSGGDLPATLEQAAADLREMARLEGVVRTKTADGRMQTLVIAVIPVPMILLIHFMDGKFFDPLRFDFAGHLIVAAATVLWILAILSARKILDVDI